MTQYDNTNRGALFKNDRKQQDNHPDYTGSINVGGVEYWLSAWLKDGAKGKFFSMSIKPKDDKPQQQSLGSKGRPAPSRATNNADMDDEIPF